MLVDDFNEYAKKNDLDITFEVILFTKANSTVYSDGGQITIDTLLQSGSQRYDIYFFVNNNYQPFRDDLVDLKEYISPEIIELYDSEIFRKTCLYKDKIISFVNTFIYYIFNYFVKILINFTMININIYLFIITINIISIFKYYILYHYF